MKINIKGTVVIVGNYGSGKTEVSVNLAASRKKDGIDVCIADLDLVNPYFRTREAVKPLSEMGINVITPAHDYLKADLPILSADVSRIIRNPKELTILDAGGNDAGAMVFAALADSLADKKIKVLQVVNPFRPFTETIKGCLEIRTQIEKACKLSVNGIIANPNLIDETNEKHIYKGYEFCLAYAKHTGLDLEFISISSEIVPLIDISNFSCSFLQMKRQLVPPWKRAGIF